MSAPFFLRSRLKAATRLLVRDVGTVDAAAAITGKGKSQVGRYQHVDHDDFMPIDVVAALESLEGVSPHITQALAAASGHILLACPAGLADGAWMGRLGDLAREAGELSAGLCEALRDGAITASEIASNDLRLNVAQLQSVLAGIDRALEQIERDAAPPKT